MCNRLRVTPTASALIATSHSGRTVKQWTHSEDVAPELGQYGAGYQKDICTQRLAGY
jgi:hypothetical protein